MVVVHHLHLDVKLFGNNNKSLSLFSYSLYSSLAILAKVDVSMTPHRWRTGWEGLDALFLCVSCPSSVVCIIYIRGTSSFYPLVRPSYSSSTSSLLASVCVYLLNVNEFLNSRTHRGQFRLYRRMNRNWILKLLSGRMCPPSFLHRQNAIADQKMKRIKKKVAPPFTTGAVKPLICCGII